MKEAKKFMKYKIIFLISIFAFHLLAITRVYATSIPTFPSCSSPEGTIKVQYDSGVHGIVGRTEEYRGKDTVYTISDTTLLQCFCSENASTGIQTNWWKVNAITSDEVQQLKNQGWYFVPNGSLWGLSGDPYMAKNIEYSCGGNTGGTGGSSSGGGVISAFTSVNPGSVLGLPATGNDALILGFLLLTLIYLVMRAKKRIQRI